MQVEVVCTKHKMFVHVVDEYTNREKLLRDLMHFQCNFERGNSGILAAPGCQACGYKQISKRVLLHKYTPRETALTPCPYLVGSQRDKL